MWGKLPLSLHEPQASTFEGGTADFQGAGGRVGGLGWMLEMDKTAAARTPPGLFRAL